MANPQMNMSVEVPQEMVRAHIQKAVAEALGADPSALVQTVVDVAMRAKERSYGSETIFGEAVNKMIRDAAKGVFAEWLETQKDTIRQALLKRLATQGSAFVEQVADQLIKGLSESFYVSVHLKIEE